MNFTLSDLNNLKAALVTGAMSVQIGDRTITYRSQSEIISLIKLIDAQLNPPAVTATSPDIVSAKFSKGAR